MKFIRLFAYILPTVLLITYSQLIIKWRISKLGEFPSDIFSSVIFIAKAFLDPYIASGVLSAFIAALTWMVAISKIPLNVGFPVYYGLTFAFVILCSTCILHEPISGLKLLGIFMILVGVIIGSMG